MNLNVVGTLGDSYITACKLVHVEEPIHIRHYTRCDYWYDDIRDIYRLVPNITVEFVEKFGKDEKIFSSLPKDDNMQYFPEFFPEAKKDYVVIQAHSGKPMEDLKSGNTKMLEAEFIQKVVKKVRNPVLIGTHKSYKHISGCLNLIGECSVIETMKIVAESSEFIGPEGLMGFVALSHKVNSILFYTSDMAMNARVFGTPWEQYAKCYKLQEVSIR